MADWRRRVGRIVTDSQGQTGAIAVTVKKAGTSTLVTLKANKAGTEAQSNPFDTDAYGVWTFFVDVETLTSCDYELDVSFEKSGYGFAVMNEMWENHSMIGAVAVGGIVLESDFDATTLLYATADNTPVPTTPTQLMAILTAAVPNQLVDHTAVTIATGNGLAGGGDISSDRTFSVGPGTGIVVSSTTVGVKGVLEDLFALTAPASDGQFIVATGTGVFQYESGATARASLTAAKSGVNADITGLTALATQAAVQINPFGTSAGETGEIRFLELAGGGTHYTGFKAPDALAGDVIYVLPIADSTGAQYLRSDGSKNLSWATIVGGGDVLAFGTPVNNQLAIWTAADTIEGDTNLQWSGSVLTVLGGLIVGVSDTGHDVIFYGATANARFLFDQANDAVVLGGGTATMELRFLEGSGGGTSYVGFQAPATLAGDVIWVLPNTDSTGTQALVSDGSLALSWATITGDVAKVGTPVDNEIGVWTGDGTIEGDTNFQWDAAAFIMLGTQFIKEQADAAADKSGYGQFWVNIVATPDRNAPCFTDEAGNDAQLDVRYIEYRVLDKDTDTAIEDGVGGEFRVPQEMYVLDVGAYVDSAGDTDVTTYDIEEGGATILTTLITIDANEKTSVTADVPSVIGGAGPVITKDAIITFNIDGISSGTAAKGSTIWMKVLLTPA